MSNEILMLILAGFAVTVGLGVGSIGYLYFFRLWFRTHTAHCPLPLSTIVGLLLRRASPQIVVNSYIDLQKAGLKVTVEELEARFKAGANIRLVARAMVAANTHGNDVDFVKACAIDLQGKNVMEEIGLSGELSSVTID